METDQVAIICAMVVGVILIVGVTIHETIVDVKKLELSQTIHQEK